MTPRLRGNIAVLLIVASLAPASALAAAFGVTPIRVDLDAAARTGIVHVSNDDTRKLYFQLKLSEWTQAPDGQDRYADSSDLIFFPQILVIDPKERRLVRVGLKGPLPARERTYRLFIEEMPDPGEKGAAAGAQIAVRMRFGVPIFVADGKGEAKPEFVGAEAAKGLVRVELRNTGERQIRFEELLVLSGDKVVARSPGWYVFPGVTKSFSIPVDRAACPLSGSLELRAVVPGKDVRRNIEASPVLCSP